MSNQKMELIERIGIGAFTCFFIALFSVAIFLPNDECTETRTSVPCNAIIRHKV